MKYAILMNELNPNDLKRGQRVLFLGEIGNMKSHYAFSANDKIYHGYHLDDFIIYNDNYGEGEYNKHNSEQMCLSDFFYSHKQEIYINDCFWKHYKEIYGNELSQHHERDIVHGMYLELKY